MPHPASYRAALRAVVALLLAVLAAVLGTLLSVPALAVGAQASAAGTDPLLVHLDAITPVLPRSASVEISGTVTNTTDGDYTRVNLHAFSSEAPITAAPQLAAAAAAPTELFVGERVTVPGTFDTIETLASGETAGFSMSVPVELLHASGEPGVYWIGVHALGDSVLPRDLSTGGMARTFIPAQPRGDDVLEASVILPLRARVWHQPDGRVGGADRWARWFAEGGRLDTVLDVADAASGNAYTWLVDPAILAAVTRLAAGNPARSLAPDPAIPDPEQPAPPPEEETPDGESPTPSTETITPPTTTDEGDEPTAEQLALAAAAQAWLDRFAATSAGRPVLALPYGDLDVSAAVRHRPERYDQARTRSAEVMAELGIEAAPALAPETDVLTSEAMLAAPEDTTILLGDTAFTSPPVTPNSTVRLLGHRVVVTSTGAQSGGPAPTRADDPLAMRQRLLSEAALRLAAGSTAPLVVTLPNGWSPEDAGALFSAFEEPWLRSVSVTEVADRSAVGIPGAALAYTEEDVAAELAAANFLAADRFGQAAALLEEVLARQTRVEQQVRDEALVTLSQQHRSQPRLALRSAATAREGLTDLLAKVRIDPPSKVILSSDTGRLGATIINGLDQPVVVRVVATSDGEMTLVGPDELQLAPGSRSLVRFQATAERPGVHNVRLSVTSTTSSTALGSSARIPIRAAQVSGLIWVVMAAGASLLLSAAGLRLWREVRARRRAEPGEASEVATSESPDPGGAPRGPDARTPLGHRSPA